MTGCRLTLAMVLLCALAAGAGAQQQALVDEGLAAVKAGKVDESIGLFSEAIQQNPQDSRAWCGRAYAYSVKRDLNDGLRDVVQALKIDPRFAKAYCVMGNIFWLGNDPNKAGEAFERAVEYAPNDPDVVYNRALFELHRDDDKAIADCTTVIRLSPTYADAYYIKGNAYLDQQKYDDALTAYTEGIRLKPDYANLYHQRGLVYERMGEWTEAIDDLGRSIRLQPGNDSEYFTRGSIYAQEKEYAQAIDDFSRAIELNPKSANYFLQRSIAYKAEGDEQKASDDMKQVLLLKGAIKAEPSP